MDGTAQATLTVNIFGVDEVNAGFQKIGSAAVDMNSKVSGAAVEMGTKTTENVRRMGDSSENMSRQMRGLGREIGVLGASGVAIGKLGEQFGLLNKQQADVITTMGSMVALFGTVTRGLSYLADASWLVTLAEKARGAAHAFAQFMASNITAIGGAIVSALKAIASSSIAVAIADKARAMASAVAHAFEGPWGWAILAAAAGIAAVAVASISGLLKFGEGGLVMGPTIGLIGEREPELIVPLSRIMNWNTTSKPTTIYLTINESRTPRATGNAVVDALRAATVV